MKFPSKWLQFGRAQRIRTLLLVLMACSAAYLLINITHLNNVFQQTGSWQGIWQVEWQSGRIITEVITSGLFQFFMLAIGWSAWYRMRMSEIANLRLRRSENKYRSIINHAGEAIFLVDRAGRILEWNKAAEKLFRVPRRTALTSRLQGLELGLNLEEVFASTEKTQRSLAHEIQLAAEDDQPTLVRLTFSHISPGAGLTAEKSGSFVVIARDITSERQLETRMSETEKLAGIGQLAAGIAHQLNTPLGSILLSAQMLEDAVEEEDDVEDIRRIIRQTEQCRGIIKGLLNFARPTGSERGRMNLGEAIDETVFLMDKNLKLAGVTVEIASDIDPWVYGNRNELEQVFFNLLVNALDAMPSGGIIRIQLGSGDPGEILIEFSDSGEGIAAEHQDRIFLPFFTTKDYGKGTGLGLSIVARIVHEHGGRIELDSDPGQGTKFRLSFPRVRDSESGSGLIDDQTLDWF